MKRELYTLGAFEYVADVQIIKGRLESEGIPVFLKDEHTLNSDPMISHAIGGVKLQVYTWDMERALGIYNEIRSYALDSHGLPLRCANCKAQRLEAYYKGKNLFYKLFPFFEKKKYKCLNCNMITFYPLSGL
ncbi:MAG: DUF2007 domain-containing protein [Sediminicola sp.]